MNILRFLIFVFIACLVSKGAFANDEEIKIEIRKYYRENAILESKIDELDRLMRRSSRNEIEGLKSGKNRLQDKIESNKIQIDRLIQQRIDLKLKSATTNGEQFIVLDLEKLRVESVLAQYNAEWNGVVTSERRAELKHKLTFLNGYFDQLTERANILAIGAKACESLRVAR